MLKNRLSQLCRAIKAVAGESKIFICDTLPDSSLLENQQIIRYNKDLFLATQHVNRELERIFFLSMHAHFYLNNEGIQLWGQYFCNSGDLTSIGCLTFRVCMVREVGITRYSL